jgi:hypothetical protein
MHAIANNNDFWALGEAARILRRLVKDNPAPLPHIFKNLGITYARLGRNQVRVV